MNYKNDLSKVITNRYTSEPFLNQTDSLSNQKVTKIESKKDEKLDIDARKDSLNKKFLIYGKNFDTLAENIMALFSRDYNKTLLKDDNAKKDDENEDLECFIKICDDDEQDETNNNMINAEDDASDLSEEDSGKSDTDSIFDYPNNGILNPDLDYEDDRLILSTNTSFKDYLVMKICNDLKTDLNRNKKLSKKLRKYLKNIEKYEQEFDVGTHNENLIDVNGANNEDLNNSDLCNYQEYDDDYDQDLDDYEYQYKEVLSEHLIKIFQSYDGVLSADLFLKQPNFNDLLDSHVRQVVENLNKEEIEIKKEDEGRKEEDEENDWDTDSYREQKLVEKQKDKEEKEKKRKEEIRKSIEQFDIFKRMMIKKKYVLATVKHEKEYGYNRRTKLKSKNSNSVKSSLSRPYTASLFANSVSSDVKLNRPRTATTLMLEKENTALTPTNVQSDSDYFYEPYRLSSSLNKEPWPFELDFDPITTKKNKKISSASKSTKNSKCFPCKKFPIVNTTNDTVIAPQISGRQIRQNKSKSNLTNTEKDNVSTSINIHQNQTYNSARRCISAKLIEVSADFDSSKIDNESNELVIQNGIGDITPDLDIETEELLGIKRNLDMNKEEHLRKMNLSPGKNFHSQRSKSISIEHVPISKLKIETQKARIPFKISTASNSTLNSGRQSANIALITQNIAGPKLILRNATNTSCDFYSQNSSSPNNSNAICSKDANSLAIQHQEEIYALINKSKEFTGNTNNNSNNKKVIDYKILLATNLNSNNTLVKNDLLSHKTNKLNLKTKRPRTSKT
jgi:hypothetical protein